MPEVALRQIWHADISKPTRIRLATVGVRTVDLFSNLAQSADAVVAAIAVLIGGDEPFGTGAEQIMAKTRVASAWNKAKNHVTYTDTLRARLQDDPRRIPEISDTEHLEYRAASMQRHPDILLAPHREPHKKFIERVIRDLLVHECVPAYKLWEVRLASETIATSSTFSRNANDLLKISEEEVSPSVDSEEDAINRIIALFVAVEYLGSSLKVCSSTAKARLFGGALSFLGELDKRRLQTPGLKYILLADAGIRG